MVTVSPLLVWQKITITITGPSSGYTAVGFNAGLMSDAPYTIIANSTNVRTCVHACVLRACVRSCMRTCVRVGEYV